MYRGRRSPSPSNRSDTQIRPRSALLLSKSLDIHNTNNISNISSKINSTVQEVFSDQISDHGSIFIESNATNAPQHVSVRPKTASM